MTVARTAAAAPTVKAPARSVGIDIVRTVGILGIVAGHVWGRANVFYTWHVPVFFILTGYLWRDHRPFHMELQSRIRSLLLPYLTWLLGITAAWLVYTSLTTAHEHRYSLRELALGGWYLRSPYLAFWFLTSLFIAALLMRLAGRVGRAVPWLVGLTGLVLSAHDAKDLRELALAAGPALIGVFFIAAGTLLRDVRSRLRPALLVGPLILVPSFLLGYEGVVRPVNLKAAFTGTPYLSALLSVMICVGLILTAEAVSPAVPSWLGRQITDFARMGLAIILGHSLVLTVGVRSGMDRDVWMFLLATALPLVPALLVRRTRLAPLVLGPA